MKVKTQAIDLNNHLRQLLATVKPGAKYLKRLDVKTTAQTILVQTEDIDWISAAGNYLELHDGKEIHLIRERISRMEQKIDPEKLARVHRSTIVNLVRIKTLHHIFYGDQIVILRDDTELNMSRSFTKSFLCSYETNSFLLILCLNKQLITRFIYSSLNRYRLYIYL